jgi:hypothetical protein
MCSRRSRYTLCAQNKLENINYSKEGIFSFTFRTHTLEYIFSFSLLGLVVLCLTFLPPARSGTIWGHNLDILRFASVMSKVTAYSGFQGHCSPIGPFFTPQADHLALAQNLPTTDALFQS